MAIDKAEALKEYRERASGSGGKLVRKYTAATGKLEAATSKSAQANFESAMKDPAVLKRRLTNLKKLSEEDLNSAMIATGEAAYNAAVAAKAEKWLEKTSPFLDEIDDVVAKLPARTRDGVQNVTNRVIPLVKALQDKKKEIG